jgi:ankyrin repeat protein
LENLKLSDFINQADVTGFTPIHCASFQGNIRLLDLLIIHGGKLDVEN